MDLLPTICGLLGRVDRALLLSVNGLVAMRRSLWKERTDAIFPKFDVVFLST